MALTPDRQGYLGNIETKTLPQLQELLERQEKILENRNLVKILPDKGEKVKNFAEKLRQIINAFPSETKADRPISGRNAAKSTLKNRLPENGVPYIEENDEQSIEQALTSRNEENCIMVQQEEGIIRSPGGDVGDLSCNLQELSISKKSQGVPKFTNSYEQVIKKAETRNDKSKPKFLPHRSLKYPVGSSPSLHHVKTDTKVSKPLEESAVYPPKYTHQESKLISIEESVSLIQEQKERSKNLIAEHAAQRLANQLGPKMDAYTPNTPDLQYRTKPDGAEKVYDSDDVPSDEEFDDVD